MRARFSFKEVQDICRRIDPEPEITARGQDHDALKGSPVHALSHN